MPRREQLPQVLLAMAAVVVAGALGLLVLEVRQGAPPLEAVEVAHLDRGEPHGAAETRSPAAARLEPSGPSEPAPRAPIAAPPAGEGGPAAAPVSTPEDEDEPPADPLAARMQEATALYDRADYEGASARAIEVLDKDPDNVRMLRIAVSSSCILGEGERARPYYAKLPERDQRQIARRCARFGIEF